jgi:twitching motility two-component system response regulator PilH
MMALVLIVDDSPTEQHVFCEMLEKHGFETIVASDGEEAIQTAERVQPAAIIMDVVMPGMDGYQATRKLAKQPSTQSIPVVMVSTKGQETDRIWGLRQGAVEYLVKPVSSDLLVTAVKNVLAQ